MDIPAPAAAAAVFTVEAYHAWLTLHPQPDDDERKDAPWAAEHAAWLAQFRDVQKTTAARALHLYADDLFLAYFKQTPPPDLAAAESDATSNTQGAVSNALRILAFWHDNGPKMHLHAAEPSRLHVLGLVARAERNDVNEAVVEALRASTSSREHVASCSRRIAVLEAERRAWLLEEANDAARLANVRTYARALYTGKVEAGPPRWPVNAGYADAMISGRAPDNKRKLGDTADESNKKPRDE